MHKGACDLSLCHAFVSYATAISLNAKDSTTRFFGDRRLARQNFVRVAAVRSYYSEIA